MTDTFLTTTGAGVATEELVGVVAAFALVGAGAADLFAATDWEAAIAGAAVLCVFAAKATVLRMSNIPTELNSCFSLITFLPTRASLLSRVGDFRRLNKCYR